MRLPIIVVDSKLRKSGCHVITTKAGYEVGVLLPAASHTDI